MPGRLSCMIGKLMRGWRSWVMVALKACCLAVLLPAGMVRAAALLSRALAIPELICASGPHATALKVAGTALAVVGAYVAVRACLILAVIGKRWPFADTAFLVDRYIYRFARHPLWWGYGVFWIGEALRRGSLALLTEALVLTAGLLCHAVLFEEPRLRRRFGEPYAEYRLRTPLVWPKWSALARDAAELNWFATLTMGLMRALLGLLWNVRAEGLEHVPLRGGCILLSNHVNLADPFLIGLFMTRPVRFMASDELFRPLAARVLFRLLGAFPKRRWTGDTRALRTVHRFLGAGQVVGIFPEGRRSWDGAAGPIEDGVYRFLQRCDAPVVCVSLIGGHEAYPRWSRLPRLCDVTVRFHAAVSTSQFRGVEDLRGAVETRIFAGMAEPARAPRRWASHRGITRLAWGCIRCGTAGTLEETRHGVTCRACGAVWVISPTLRFHDRETAEVLSQAQYRDRLRTLVKKQALRGLLSASTGATAFRIDPRGRLIRLGVGILEVTGEALRFVSPQGAVTINPREVRFAYLNLANHLVVTGEADTLQFAIRGRNASPVRWEDYLEAVRAARREERCPRDR